MHTHCTAWGQRLKIFECLSVPLFGKTKHTETNIHPQPHTLTLLLPVVRWWRRRVPPGRPGGRTSVSTTLWWSCRRSQQRSWCSRSWRPCRRSQRRGRAAWPAVARHLFPRSSPGSRPSPWEEDSARQHCYQTPMKTSVLESLSSGMSASEAHFK